MAFERRMAVASAAAVLVLALVPVSTLATGGPPAEAVAYEHFTYVRHVATDRVGTLYVVQGCGSYDCEGGLVGSAGSDGVFAKVWRIDSHGATLAFAASTQDGLSTGFPGIAFDCSNRLHVGTGSSDGRLWRVESEGPVQVFAKPGLRLTGFDFDCHGLLGPAGAVYAAGSNISSNSIRRIQLDLGAEAVFASFPFGVTDVTFNGTQTFVVDKIGGRVVDLHADGTTTEVFRRADAMPMCPPELSSVAVRPDGRWFYVNDLQSCDFAKVFTLGPMGPFYAPILDVHSTMAVGAPVWCWDHVLPPCQNAPNQPLFPQNVGTARWETQLGAPTNATLHFYVQDSTAQTLVNEARLTVYRQVAQGGYSPYAFFEPGDRTIRLEPVNEGFAQGKLYWVLTASRGALIDYTIQVVPEP